MSEDKENKEKVYSADSIQALEGIEHARMRPSMYIGDVGTRGLHHLVYEWQIILLMKHLQVIVIK